jgi:hypothetical protein
MAAPNVQRTKRVRIRKRPLRTYFFWNSLWTILIISEINVQIKRSFFQNKNLCRLIYRYHSFGGTYYLHLQGSLIYPVCVQRTYKKKRRRCKDVCYETLMSTKCGITEMDYGYARELKKYEDLLVLFLCRWQPCNMWTWNATQIYIDIHLKT